MSSRPTMPQQGHINLEHEFYRTLEPGQIRTLKVESSKKLSFKLEVVSLAARPKYGALSYVWGDSTLCEQITVQGKVFWVTRNLFLALDQFRKGIDSKKPNPLKKNLWVDAICINQGDSEPAKIERSGQVQQMTEIFESAETVYVWLGVTSDETRNRLATAKLAHFEELYLRAQLGLSGKAARKDFDRNSELANILRDIGSAEAGKWSQPETQTKDAWLGIIALWKSEWWKRAWAYQEGTVPDLGFFLMRKYQKLSPPKQAETKVAFIAGNACTTWNAMSVALGITDYIMASPAPGTEVLKGTAMAFSKVAAICRQRQISLKAAGDSFNPLEAINRFYMFNKKSMLADPTPLDPLETLNRFRMGECKDPRDKVFAAIGLLPTLRSTLTVDYRRSTLEIYIDLIAKIVSAPNASLDFLGFTCKTHNGTDIVVQKRPNIEWETFPSWLPNWYMPLNITPLPKALNVRAPPGRHERYKFVARGTASMVPAYSACGRFTIPNAVIGGNLLHSPGWQLDTLSDVMRFDLPPSDRTAVVTGWRTQLSRTTYPDCAVFDRDLRRVHCADVKYESGDPVSRGYEIVNTLLNANRGDLDKKQLSEQTMMKATIRLSTGNRALCMTSKGRLGLVPYTALVGDKIVALFGGQVLYVLRRKGTAEEQYEYIGEAYIHGLMDGEVSSMADRGEINTQVFTLR